MPEMDYAQLRERIKDCGYTQKKCAEQIGISESQLNRKLAGEYVFRQDEINKLCVLLQIDGEEMGKYFFSPKLRNINRLAESKPIERG